VCALQVAGLLLLSAAGHRMVQQIWDHLARGAKLQIAGELRQLPSRQAPTHSVFNYEERSL
jgi:hypothetical protein